MSVFNKYLLTKDSSVRRRIEIDVSLYEQLADLASNVYDASINKLVNIALIELINTEKVEIYKRKDGEFTESHNFLIRNSTYKELEKLKDKYGLSIYKLVNIAIYNALNS